MRKIIYTLLIICTGMIRADGDHSFNPLTEEIKLGELSELAVKHFDIHLAKKYILKIENSDLPIEKKIFLLLKSRHQAKTVVKAAKIYPVFYSPAALGLLTYSLATIGCLLLVKDELATFTRKERINHVVTLIAGMTTTVSILAIATPRQEDDKAAEIIECIQVSLNRLLQIGSPERKK
jgi:hypothetical protein